MCNFYVISIGRYLCLCVLNQHWSGFSPALDALIATVPVVIHKPDTPLSSSCLTPVLCFFFFCLFGCFLFVTDKATSPAFFWKTCWVRLSECWWFELTHKSVIFCFADSSFPSSTNARRWCQWFCRQVGHIWLLINPNLHSLLDTILPSSGISVYCNCTHNEVCKLLQWI